MGNQNSLDRINRDAMIVYLNNMRIIETVLHESEKAAARMDSELSSLDADVRNAQNRLANARSNVTDGKAHDAGQNAVIVLVVGVIIALIGWGLAWVCENFLWGLFDEFGLTGIMRLIMYAGIAVAVIGPFIAAKKSKDEAQDRQQYSISNVSDQEQALQDAQQRAQEAHRRYDSLLTQVNRQIGTYRTLRDNGYALNIIPFSSNPSTNCRSLQGVLFLYEFMSTSRESFTTALEHYKYELIINRLDTLIDQVNTMIRNQDAILRRQEETLQAVRESGRRIGESLDAIRDYDSIIAQNSALQTEMSRESLYYQRMTYIKNM